MSILEFRAWEPKPWKHINPNVAHFSLFAIESDESYRQYANGMCIDNTIIEQFTGLRDKNERRVFVGDIVKGSTKMDGSFFAPVIFTNCRFTIDRTKAIQIENPPDWEEKHPAVHSNGFYIHWNPNGYNTIENGMENIEVVGNIHENPELLEKR